MTDESVQALPEYIMATVRDLQEKEEEATRKAQEIRRLRREIIGVYNCPGQSKSQDTSHDTSQELADCPVSAAEMAAIGDPYLIVCNIGYRAPDKLVNQTRAARWLRAAGITDRSPESYKTTLGRLMDKRKDHWEITEPGTFRYIGPPVHDLTEDSSTDPEHPGNDGNDSREGAEN